MKRTTDEIRTALLEERYEEAFRLCNDLRRKAAGKPFEADVLYYGVCALFGLGHIHQAEEWVAEHGRVTKHQAANLYLDAYLQLHARNFQKALLNWTRVLQLDPSQTLADVLIDKLKSGENEVFREIRNPEAFIRYVPLEQTARPEPSRKAARAAKPVTNASLIKKVLIYLGLVTAGGAGLGLFIALVLLPALGKKDPYRELTEKLPGAPLEGTVISPENIQGAPPRFLYKGRADVIADYQLAREKIIARQANQARFLLAKIELSNASFELKERALLLRDMIPLVNADDFRDSFGAREIRQEPYMLRGSQIDWSGTVASPEFLDGEARFELKQNDFTEAQIFVSFPCKKLGKPCPQRDALKSGARAQVQGSFERLTETGRLIVRAREVKLGN